MSKQEPPSRNTDHLETLASGSEGVSGSVSMWQPTARASEPPESIAGYRVLSLLGTGGMGNVYLAEQETPKRTVALKVIKPGSSSESMLKRFKHEVSVLGLLKHPGIAQIYDAGIARTPAGPQPYFAMELIRGRSLTEYASAEALGTRERLELMAKVCDAVQHAHHRGVIHRDLKPGNIMVENDGQPKVLDFGVARATDQDIHVATMQTDVGQLVGTLPYMSPEQVGGDPRELDTRSDVYTLGVVLFELLAGRLPHDVATRAITEAIRMIGEQDAPRLSAIVEGVSTDVETIVAKALDRDKQRRYQSAGDLSEDIRRYLRDEPIAARPPSTIYQLSKFARRHKPLVVASGLSALLLVGGVLGIVWQGVLAERAKETAIRERGVAELATTRAVLERERAEHARTLAEQQRIKAEAVSSFLRDMLASADPGGRNGRDVRVVDVLKDASARIASRPEMAEQPDLQAMLWETIGETLFGLGQYADAESEFRRSFERYLTTKGPDARETLTAKHNIGVVLRHQGKLEQAEDQLREVYLRRRALVGPDDVDTLHTADNLATTLRWQGKLDEAREIYERVLEARSRSGGPDSPLTLFTKNNLALVLRDHGQLAEAERILRETLELKLKAFSEQGPEHPEILTARYNLALTIGEQSRFDEARAMLEETASARSRVLGPSHEHTLRTIVALADVRRRSGDASAALVLLLPVRDQLAAMSLESGISGMVARDALATTLCELGRFEEAEREAREAVQLAERLLGPQAWVPFDYRRAYGWALGGLDRNSEAELELTRSTTELAARLGAAHWRTKDSASRLAWFYERTGQDEDAARVRQQYAVNR